MAKKENEYEKLPGRGRTALGGTSRLFLGRDHLLRVNSTGWTENYRRFYYNDIQAVIINLTSRRLAWNIVHASLCALLILWFLDTGDVTGRIVLICFAALFGVLFLVNTLRGPTCRTRLRTRIGIESLPSLRRLRKTRQALALLKPHLQAAQGELNPAEIPQKLAEMTPQPGTSIRPPVQYENSYAGGFHWVLFALFLAEAAAFAMNAFAPGLAATIFVLGASIVAAIATIVALVRQSGSGLATPVRVVTWFGLVHTILVFLGAYVLKVATAIKSPRIAADPAAMLIAMSELKNPWVHGIYIFMAGYALLLAIAGMLMLRISSAPENEAAATSPLP